jgi:hypothetical protein
MEKSTNGSDADQAPGPLILAGAPVSWTYEVTNTSNVTLSNVDVTDDQGVTVACPTTQLAPGEDMTCSAAGIANPGQYTNTGTVIGEPPELPALMSSDKSHYFGVAPEVTIEKYTNGQDADTPPGPYIEAGGAVSWTYIITNSGNISLTNVTVSDDQVQSVVCPKTVLVPGEGMVCTAFGLAIPDQYTNTGLITGTVVIGPEVSDSDISHYFGSVPGIDIEKHTNGEDADTPPGPFLTEGDPVLWEYLVINIGNALLTEVSVTDDQEGPITCPQTALDPGESMTCTALGIAEIGLYSNLGTVTGLPPVGIQVEADDPGHYTGEEGIVYAYLPVVLGD